MRARSALVVVVLVGHALSGQLLMSTAAAAEQSFTLSTVTRAHRFDKPHMFGGWGPHLGHLLRSPVGDLWFADDLGNDVNHNRGIAYYRFDERLKVWLHHGINVPGGRVQQNTGSLMDGAGVIFSYGIDVDNHRIVQCTFDTVSGNRGCAPFQQFPLDASANYIGAALTPSGYKIVWWTDVRDGHSGYFNYVYNYGSGWNRAPTAHLPGFVDASYVNIAFKDDNNFTMLAELPAGYAPHWSYRVGFADVVMGKEVAWSTPFDGGSKDPEALFSPNDIWVDPGSKASHLIARGNINASYTRYFFRSTGSWSEMKLSFNAPFARFVATGDCREPQTECKLYLVYADATHGLIYRVAGRELVGTAIDWSKLDEHPLKIPGYQNIHAIYPESRIYQTGPVKRFSIAVNDAKNELEVLSVIEKLQ